MKFPSDGQQKQPPKWRSKQKLGVHEQSDDLVVWLSPTFSFMTGTTLTGARSLTAKAEIEVETRRSSWVV